MAHTRQSGPDFGLGFQVKVLQKFEVVPFSLGSGPCNIDRLKHGNSWARRRGRKRGRRKVGGSLDVSGPVTMTYGYVGQGGGQGGGGGGG